MQRSTKSLLEELENISAKHDKKHVIESRACNIITGAINLLESLEQDCSAEEYQMLERKLLSAIKNKDKNRFTKMLRKLNETNK